MPFSQGKLPGYPDAYNYAYQQRCFLNPNPNTQLPPYEEFVALLRSALHYLYDPVHLRRSPLVAYLDQGGAPDRATALQRVLTDSINSLKPSENEPPQSTAWAIYDILNLQYVRQYERNVVASQLGISERQLRREQRLALEALAQHLWQKFNFNSLSTTPGEPAAAHGEPAAAHGEPIAEPPGADTGSLSTELNWLKSSPIEELGGLKDTLQSVQALANPLAEQCAVTLQLHIDPLLEETPIPQASFRSILLTILNAILPRAEKGSVTLSAARTGPMIQIQIASTQIRAAPEALKDEGNLDTVRQLAAFYGAGLEISYAPPLFSANLRFAFPEQIPILVIDDNGDWLEMLKRYVVGTRYQVITTRDSRAAVALAEKIQPAVIFLDVMMPNVDGWQVLSELRQQQATHRIPLVVCTVLPLADLALSLGVNVFLQKPITQEQFLHTIQEQLNKDAE